MKNNEDLQRDVQNAIMWEPLLNAAEIGVIAKDGLITLTGVVDCYAKKLEAEQAAKSVAGVKAVIEKISIKFGDWGERDDNKIAIDVLNAFNWNWEVPNDKINVKVENGWLTLEGELHWNFQREAAVKAVKNLVGVTGVTNLIIIKSETHNDIEKADIEGAINRNWANNSEDIAVEVSGTDVTISGKVGSWFQKDEAERIAWNAPGVWNVHNDIIVDYN